MINLDLIAEIALSVVIAALVIYIIKLKISRKRLANSLITSSTKETILLAELEKAIAAREEKSVEQTDGFLEFISKSRDWAYEYIEEVQTGLKKFIDEAGPEIKYSKTYGSVVGNPLSPSIDKISEAFEELEALMPRDTNK